MNGKFAFVLALCAGQAIAQPFALNEPVIMEAAVCTTIEAALEVADIIASRGIPAGRTLFDEKENCAVVLVQLRPTRLSAFFKTPEGMLKVVEAFIGGDKVKVYVLTFSDLKGIEVI